MNAIRELAEPMGGDVECSEAISEMTLSNGKLLSVTNVEPCSIVVIYQFNSECYILFQNEIYVRT